MKLTTLRSLLEFLPAAIRWGKATFVTPQDADESLPPIRCHGRYQDIYLD